MSEEMKAIVVDNLSHRYGDRVALDHVSFTIERGQYFCLIGPNGGGKTTLFRLLTTAFRPQSGTISIFGEDIARNPASIRRHIGVVFQSPSLDGKLNVLENLRCGGMLYGLSGSALQTRIEEVVEAVGLEDRLRDRVEILSGGLQRRVEIAKSLLHRPRLLILDEPSTGLDPAVRLQIWNVFEQLRRSAELTIILTSHIMEEADRADKIAFMHQGRLIRLGTPDELKQDLATAVLSLQTPNPHHLAETLHARYGSRLQIRDREVRVETANPHEDTVELSRQFGDSITAISLTKSSLEDVFVRATGTTFAEADSGSACGQRRGE